MINIIIQYNILLYVVLYMYMTTVRFFSTPLYRKNSKKKNAARLLVVTLRYNMASARRGVYNGRAFQIYNSDLPTLFARLIGSVSKREFLRGSRSARVAFGREGVASRTRGEVGYMISLS